MPRNLVKIIPTKNTFDIYKTPEISCFTKLSIYPLTTPSGPPTMTILPCYDNCTLFITLYIPDKNTIDYLLLLFVSPICKLPAKTQLVNGKHEVLRTLFFSTRIDNQNSENIGTRRSEKKRARNYGPKISSAHEKKN
jgi:hypothetical protein